MKTTRAASGTRRGRRTPGRTRRQQGDHIGTHGFGDRVLQRTASARRRRWPLKSGGENHYITEK